MPKEKDLTAEEVIKMVSTYMNPQHVAFVDLQWQNNTHDPRH